MATDEGRPTPDEARAALDQAGVDEDAVRYPPIPAWFFAVMAALVGGLNLAQMLSSSASSKATVDIGIVALVLGGRYWLHRDGVAWTSLKLGDMAPFLVGLLGTMATCWLIDDLTDAPWVWIIGAVVTGGIVLRTGQTYRRTFGG